ncbi:hypothetical protein LY90DRAFT_519920 [Neocallimastix californiae]|uniref:Uncharacterized protein n=1 Tax=Neocallimastix californiae TaxID=1754190 RepID=A0A1Y1YMJ7_9FUNG|nr:hypothetical protein LY90DRAFT_519920 [Neocallimastix californiae]|eukprot:ORX99232.1 hypothetical protein LY90DRAFT_519920 [Neocallimastix californiae]
MCCTILDHKINMIHPQLAKEMGFKREDRPLTFTIAASKVLIPQVTKIDIHDQQPKVFKIDGEKPGLPDVDSPGECEGESIYMVQINEKEEAEPEETKPIARITQLINQVINN